MIDSRTVPIRFSNLKMMAETPAHYLWAINHPFAPTPSMKVGTIAHSLVLGKSSPYCIYQGERRGNAWKDFVTEHPGQEIFTIAEYDRAMPIADAIAANNDAAEVLRGECERHIDWSYCGRAATSRPDVRGVSFVTDVKTTRSAKPAFFAADSFRRAYHAQLAFYQLACGLPETAPCFIVAVENKAPYCVTVFQVEQAAIDAGHMQCRAWLERLLVCEEANDWPAYARGLVPLGIPERDVELTFGDEEESEEP